MIKQTRKQMLDNGLLNPEEYIQEVSYRASLVNNRRKDFDEVVDHAVENYGVTNTLKSLQEVIKRSIKDSSKLYEITIDLEREVEDFSPPNLSAW